MKTFRHRNRLPFENDDDGDDDDNDDDNNDDEKEDEEEDDDSALWSRTEKKTDKTAF